MSHPPSQAGGSKAGIHTRTLVSEPRLLLRVPQGTGRQLLPAWQQTESLRLEII